MKTFCKKNKSNTQLLSLIELKKISLNDKQINEKRQVKFIE